MQNYLFIFVILSIASFVYLKLAAKYNIIDKPNERSSHTVVTVRGGGIVFILAVVLFSAFNNFQYPYVTIGALALAIISFLDDIYTLSAKIRFPFQFVAVGLVLFEIGLPFTPIYLYVFLVFLGIGVVNMFNFMDGINGITGMYSLSSLVGLWLINRKEQLFNQDIIYFVAISIMVFGFYNFRKKALFFAGDIGSITIGLLIYFLVVWLAVSLQAPVLFLAVFVYGADTGCTLLYRKFFTNESIFAPHRHHIYQKLVHVKKIPHLTISIVYGTIQLFLNVLLLYTYYLSTTTQWLLLGAFSLVFISIYILMFKTLKRD
jgi:UDP-N-acetylmuramyl pentapeptide phosphotransferase/UDP-N-acetylglucosamine-1-phosphate transferase